ncbi:hypothetical protein FACS189479_04280 [Spirochaetia bacterium]|nr:hypothetical protein FACS189479_04280 [Spirochaetia bacterium]
MKNVLKAFSAIALIGLLLLTGCSNILSPDIGKSQGGEGIVQIQVGTPGAALTLSPAASDFTAYGVEISGSPSYSIPPAATISPLRLSPGTYNITVTGYNGVDPDYVAVAKSAATSVTVIAGQTVTANIVLENSADQTATGFLDYSIDLGDIDVEDLTSATLTVNSTVYSVNLKVKDEDTADPDDYKQVVTGRIELLAGASTYQLDVVLISGRTVNSVALNIYRREIVYIFPGLTTNAPFVFSDEELTAFVEFTGTAWITDNRPAPELGDPALDVYVPTTAYVYFTPSATDDNYDDELSGPITPVYGNPDEPAEVTDYEWTIQVPPHLVAKTLSTTAYFSFKAESGTKELYSPWNGTASIDTHGGTSTQITASLVNVTVDSGITGGSIAITGNSDAFVREQVTGKEPTFTVTPLAGSILYGPVNAINATFDRTDDPVTNYTVTYKLTNILGNVTLDADFFTFEGTSGQTYVDSTNAAFGYKASKIDIYDRAAIDPEDSTAGRIGTATPLANGYWKPTAPIDPEYTLSGQVEFRTTWTSSGKPTLYTTDIRDVSGPGSITADAGLIPITAKVYTLAKNPTATTYGAITMTANGINTAITTTPTYAVVGQKVLVKVTPITTAGHIKNGLSVNTGGIPVTYEDEDPSAPGTYIYSFEMPEANTTANIVADYFRIAGTISVDGGTYQASRIDWVDDLGETVAGVNISSNTFTMTIPVEHRLYDSSVYGSNPRLRLTATGGGNTLVYQNPIIPTLNTSYTLGAYPNPLIASVVPTGLSASFAPSSINAIDVTWTGSADRYNVYRTDYYNDTVPLAIGLTSPSYQDTGLESGKGYTYSITGAGPWTYVGGANDGKPFGESGRSALVTVVGTTPTQLVSHEWADGNLTTPGQSDPYTFTVTTAGDYYLWYNNYHSSSGYDGNKGAYIQIVYSVSSAGGGIIYYNNGTQPLGSLSIGDTVTLNVSPWSSSTGTYAVGINPYEVVKPESVITSLSNDAWKADSLALSSDVDWFEFEVPPASGGDYYLWLNNDRSNYGDGTKTARVNVAAYSNGTPLTSFNYNQGAYTTGVSLNGYGALSAGQKVYVSVTPTDGAHTGTYAIGINGKNDQIRPETIVTPLSAYTWEDGEINNSSAVDWYTFTATTAGTYYLYRNHYSGYGGDGYKTGYIGLTIYNINDVTISVSYSSSYFNSGRAFYANAGETVYVKAAYAAGSGTYAVGVTNHVTGKPGDVTTLTVDTPVNATISRSYEVDWYEFPVVSGTRYYVYWNEGVDIDVYPYRTDTNGSLSFSNGTDSDGSGNNYITTDFTGTVRLRVRRYAGNSGTGSYSILASTSSTKPSF